MQEAVSSCGTSDLVHIMDACDIAKAVVYAATQPNHVAVNEILVEPREASL